MADHGGGKIDHPPGDAAMGEKITGQDEKGNGHDFKFLNTGKQLESHRFQGHLGHGEEKGQDREAERDRNRHPGQHQGEQDAKITMHSLFNLLLSSACESRSGRRWVSAGNFSSMMFSSYMTMIMVRQFAGFEK